MGKGLFEVLFEYWPIFLKGLWGTLKYAFIAVTLGSILGALVAIVHLSKKKAVSSLAAVYVNVLRGTPLLVQMYISYYFIPMAIQVLNNIDKIYYVMLALILNSSAYVAEIIRSGIGSVDRGQAEAARSLGLTGGQTMTRIILPQAVKNILPALCNEFISTVKGTSLASVFFVGELMTSYKTVQSATFLALESLTIVGIIYFVLNFVLSKMLVLLERRLTISD